MTTYILCWFPMLLLAVLNGGARDLIYKKYGGELSAHQVSTFTLILLFGIYIFFVIKIFPPASASQAIYIGIAWFFLTLAFEFGFGLARGNSLSHLLADYNIFKGRLWALIPTFIIVAPYLFYKFLHNE